MPPKKTVQPDFLQTDARVAWCWGNGNAVWETMQAAMSGDSTRLATLLETDPELIRCQCGYRTPLHFAIRENQLDAAKWLLEQGAEFIQTYEKWHDPPIQMARDRGHEEMARFLESYWLDRWSICPAGQAIGDSFRQQVLGLSETLIREHGVNVADRNGNKPIHWAVMTRQRELVDDLLKQGADIDDQRPDGARPLDLTNGDYYFRGWRELASDHSPSHWEMMDYVLANGAQYDLTTACRRNDHERVKSIIAEDPMAARRLPDYITWYSGYPLRSAGKAGHIEIVATLLDHGADPNQPEHGLAPFGGSLYDSTQNGHTFVLEMLLDAGGNPNQEVESSGCVLSATHDPQTIALLRDRGAIHDAFGCCYYGHAYDFATRCQADPMNAQHAELFAMAAEHGHREIVATFLEYQPDLWERAPVYLPRNQETMEWMVGNGIRVNNVSWLGVHQLHHGCSEPALNQWIELGVDLNLIDSEHQSTPLGWAARRGDHEFAKRLIDSGADPDLAGEPWATPREWALRRGHQSIVDLLPG